MNQDHQNTNAKANPYDAIIIGGGAAGLMCAATLGQKGKRVVILDHANKVGKKILMSGGGRCNFTNYDISWENYLSANSHFCKSALSRYTQYDFLDLIYKYEIPFHEKAKGQLFCDNKAKDILNMLLDECALGAVEILASTKIDSIERQELEEGSQVYTLSTSRGLFSAPSLVIATGGLSIPTMGATGFGYDIAKQFGLKVTAKHASLVPFTLAQPMLGVAQSLAGVSLPVLVETGKTSFHEDLLFTHKGLSGPAILQISNYWWPDMSIKIDFLPHDSIDDLIESWQVNGIKKNLVNALSEHMPKRLVQAWFEHIDTLKPLAERTALQLNPKEVKAISEAFHQWQHTPKGTEGYKTAEVTRGGVDTDEISSKTFEAKKVPGLYFVGEVMDVTGWLGGFNFQWAWASAWCAAQFI